VITSPAEQALAEAAAADRPASRGRQHHCSASPHHKDISARRVRTSCGSRMLDNFHCAYDATVVTRPRPRRRLLGKAIWTSCMGSSNETSFYGPVKILGPEQGPRRLFPGFGAAAAARLAVFTTGTDTGGSIRAGGIAGSPASNRLWSRFAVRHDAFASSLDQAGSGPSGRGCGRRPTSHAGFDPQDSTVSIPGPRLPAALDHLSRA